MSAQKRKMRKTRQQLEKGRRITAAFKGLCWFAAFCLIVSLIKIAAVFAVKGNDVTYVSAYALPYVRIIIAVHAALALVAILCRRKITMIISVLLTIAFFVIVAKTPIYAETTECVALPDFPCQYSLVYHEHNIYDF